MMHSEGTGLARAYAECQAITRTHAKSFYFASHVLPRQKRLSAYAVYAFCRRADNAVDGVDARLPEDRAQKNITDIHSQLDAVFDPSGTLEEPLCALRDTVLRYRIPRQYFRDLLRGVEMDLTKTRYETFEDLKEYCYCVASVVGLMMTRIFGLTSEMALQNAVDLGTAMQLTNILRDVKEDHAMGRVYLPQEDLSRFGYTEEDLNRGQVNDAFVSLMRFEISRAREYYRSAEQGIPFLADPGSRYCVRLMSATYEGILDRIEEGMYNIFSHRAHVPLGGKLRVAAHLLFRPALISRSTDLREATTHD
jgi:phytoene synthase